MSRFPSLGCYLLTVGVLVGSAAAQDRILSEMYGEGVSTYYQGDAHQADTELSNAINQGFEDPRAYYFRGINKLQQGRTNQAETDIRTGAMLEVDGTGTYNIGLALQRVQGPHRIEFERIRRDAVLTAQRARAQRSRMDTQQPLGNGREYLRDPIPAAPTRDIPDVPQPTHPSEDDPFRDDVETDEVIDEVFEDEPAEVEQDEQVFEDDEDVFGDAEDGDMAGDAGADTEATEEPAAPEEADAAPADSVDEAPADESDDIFGGDDDDIFGDAESFNRTPKAPLDELDSLFE